MAGAAQQHQFFVDSDGRLRETPVSDVVAHLRELFPALDADSLEAEIMVERTHRLLAADRDAQWAPHGLTGSRFIILRNLYTAAHGRLSMGQIASVMNLEPNNITQLVGALEREGLVQRRTAEEDRRVIFASITPKGEALFNRVMLEGSERATHAFSVLSPRERQTLSHLLSKVRMHLLANASSLDADHPSDNNRAARRSRLRRTGPRSG